MASDTDGLTDPAEEGSYEDDSSPEPPLPGDSSGGAKTTQCPTCGRQFMGDYCPSCGEAVGKDFSPKEIIGGFFREFIDIEQGFGATLAALTLRPGEALRTYLDGARGQLMNPGRYLLAAVIIGFFTREALVWAGAWSPYSTQSFAQSEEAPALTREAVALVVQALESQPGSIAITLVMAGLLSLLLRRLFRAELSGWGKALALGSFLAGHITILGAAMRLIYAPITLALTGRPAELSLSLSLGLAAVYAGIVTYGCFGSGWWSAVKGLFGLGWATAEIASLSCLGTVACALWLAWTRPSHYAVPEEGLPAFSAAMAGVAVAFSLPLLLHAATEAYYRLG